jgi:hypothetical protein
VFIKETGLKPEQLLPQEDIKKRTRKIIKNAKW